MQLEPQLGVPGLARLVAWSLASVPFFSLGVSAVLARVGFGQPPAVKSLLYATLYISLAIICRNITGRAQMTLPLGASFGGSMRTTMVGFSGVLFSLKVGGPAGAQSHLIILCSRLLGIESLPTAAHGLRTCPAESNRPLDSGIAGGGERLRLPSHAASLHRAGGAEPLGDVGRAAADQALDTRRAPDDGGAVILHWHDMSTT